MFCENSGGDVSATSADSVLYQPRVGNIRLSRESYDSSARPDEVMPERSRLAMGAVAGCRAAPEKSPRNPEVETLTSSSV